MSKKLLSVIFILFFVNISALQAQLHKISFGGGVSECYYFGDLKKINTNINVRLAYDASDRGTINIGYSYGLPINKSISLSTEPAKSIISDPEFRTQVNGLDIRTLYLNYHYFLGNDNIDRFGIYMIGGGAFTSIKGTQFIENKDQDGDTQISDSLSYLNGAFCLNAGMGMQIKKGILVFFLEATSGIPVSVFGTEKLENDVPIALAGTAGLKVHFGTDPKLRKTKKRPAKNPHYK